MREVTGVLHVHSTYSRDGEMDLATVARTFRRDGHQFICLTEHAEDVDESRWAVLVQQCRELSGDHFHVIPGLEFASREGLHILGVGLKTYVRDQSAEGIVAAIHTQSGLAIVAHPARRAESLLAAIPNLPDGVELWNTQHDTRYAPRLYRFSMLHRLRILRGEIRGYCSIDFHWTNQYRTASLVVRVEGSGQEAILAALRAGRFVSAVGSAILRPEGNLVGFERIVFVVRECFARLLMLAVRVGRRVVRALPIPQVRRSLKGIAVRLR